jgi:ribonuclease P protein component
VGIVAGKDVGSAVERNRAKRRLREAVARVPVRSGHDYVVIATRAVLEARFEELVAWVSEAVEV